MCLCANNDNYFLYCSCGPKVDHYRVRYTDDNKLSVDDETYFENLTKLVQVGPLEGVAHSTFSYQSA